MKTDRRQRQSGYRIGALCAAALTICALLFAAPVSADPVIAEAFTQQGSPCLMWYVKGVPEGQISAEATLGSIDCEITDGGLIRDQSEISYRTWILLDNSLSISQPNRDKAKKLISQIVQNHADREEFVFCTYSTELHELARGTDYSRIMEAADSVTFENQDSYLAECVTSVLESMRQEGSVSYDRLVLISDGADDNPSGRTVSDLLNLLSGDAYRCPIYAVTSIWEKDKSGLQNMTALARQVDGQVFSLDEYEDVSPIAQEIRSDYSALYFQIDVPLAERDGRARAVNLAIETSQGTYALSHVVQIPERTPEEEAELNRMLTESVPDSAEESVAEVTPTVEEPKKMVLVVESEEPVTEPDPVQTSFFGKYGALLLLGVIVLAAIIIFCILFFTKRRRDVLWEYPPVDVDDGPRHDVPAPFPPRDSPGPFSGSGGHRSPDPVSSPPSDKTDPDHTSQILDPHGGTINMWEDASFSGGKRILLDGSSMHHELGLMDEAVIGRSDLCSVVISERSVSREHCRLRLNGDDVQIEDLSSHNGTYVNGQRLTAPQILLDGDTLKMGKVELRVTIQKYQNETESRAIL